MTQTHEALKLANTLAAERDNEHRTIKYSTAGKAITRIRQQHALIVQMAHVFEGEHFEHDDQRKAIADCAQYLKAKP